MRKNAVENPFDGMTRRRSVERAAKTKLTRFETEVVFKRVFFDDGTGCAVKR